ncbi:hypothetical protein ACIQPQ_34530 [Streptomyces sp. NPDC091281]|uniref:hypothetical protein n=1 Tax=Streptomyces sp. NPDC091281 TaxID=3365985 RepID=UPI003821D0F1
MNPARTASQAADTVRSLNHATIETSDDWKYAPHAYQVLGSLARLARMLPQAIEQTLLPVQNTHGRGLLTIDGGGDPDRAIRHVANAVRTAVQAADLLARALDHAHAASSPLGVDTSKRTTP